MPTPIGLKASPTNTLLPDRVGEISPTGNKVNANEYALTVDDRSGIFEWDDGLEVVDATTTEITFDDDYEILPGDVLINDNTLEESVVQSVPTPEQVIVAQPFAVAPSLGETFKLYRHKRQILSSQGYVNIVAPNGIGVLITKSDITFGQAPVKVAAGTLTASFVPYFTIGTAATFIKISNKTNADIELSGNGSTAGWYLSAGDTDYFPLGSLLQQYTASAQIYAREVTEATTGSLIFNALG